MAETQADIRSRIRVRTTTVAYADDGEYTIESDLVWPVFCLTCYSGVLNPEVRLPEWIIHHEKHCNAQFLKERYMRIKNIPGEA